MNSKTAKFMDTTYQSPGKEVLIPERKKTEDPSFLILGAQKAATTWLTHIMNQHPDIYIPKKKEIHFFNKVYNYSKGLSWYREQFRNKQKGQVTGEATPNYLWTSSRCRDLQESQRNPNIPELVHKHYPEMKMIVILRDPVERAISAFYHHIRDRAISPSAKIMDVGKRRGIFSMGYYDEDLSSWFNYFPREQFKVIIFEEEIKRNKEKTINGIFKFLGLPDYKVENLNERYNSTEGHLYIRLHYYFPRIAKVLKYLMPPLMALDLPKIRISEQEIQQLVELYRPHNLRLESILDHPLPWKGM